MGRQVETDEYAGMIRRCVKALGRRVADGDVDALAHFAALREQLAEAETEAARALHRDYGFSWTEIARVMGTTRQNARQRYAQLELVPDVTA